MTQNISPAGSRAGAVVAAPRTPAPPDYGFHWLRDSGIVMNVVRQGGDRVRMRDFVTFNQVLQQVNTPAGLGEPRFNLDGTVDQTPWGRPQYDGPALRAIALIRFAEDLLADTNPDMGYVTGTLQPMIQKDLDYVEGQWSAHNGFDLWEESQGYHFFTRYGQGKAYQIGARLFRRLGALAKAAEYDHFASDIHQSLDSFWNAQNQVFVPILSPQGGSAGKQNLIDTSTILAMISDSDNDAWMPLTDERVLSTMFRQLDTFRNLYPINRASVGYPGVAMGRYPEDRYTGSDTGAQGNPWPLVNDGFAQIHYRLAKQLEQAGTVTFTALSLAFYQDLNPVANYHVGQVLAGGSAGFKDLLAHVLARGDTFLARVRVHLPADGSMAEQMDRNTGYMTSARNLTWSYASFVGAVQERALVTQYLGAH